MWLLAVASAQGADWPTYRGNYARTGHSAEKIAAPLGLRWVCQSASAPQLTWADPKGRVMEKFEMRPRVNYDAAFQVAVVGDRVFFGSSVDHALHCRSVATGERLWSFTTQGPVRLAPTVRDQRVYFGSDDGYAYCLDAATGRLLWKLRAAHDEEWFLARGQMISRWPVRTGILVDQGIAYFGAGLFPHETVYLCAADASDGKVIWKVDHLSEAGAGQDDLSPQGYLLASEDLLFVPSGGALPIAVDPKTGRVVYRRKHGWRTDAGGPVGGVQALLADGQVYAGGFDHMLALDQKTGDVGFGWFAGRVMTVAEQSAYVATGKEVVRLERKPYAETSRKRHQLEIDVLQIYRLMKASKGDITEHKAKVAKLNEQIDAMANEGITWRIASRSDAAIVSAGDLVFVGGDGLVQALDKATGAEKWRETVTGEAFGLAVANGHLFVSTSAGQIYCFQSGKAETGPEKIAEPVVKEPYPKDAWTIKYQAAARSILKESGVSQGFCLVLGNEEGRLAFELARQSKLRIYAVEPDEEKVKIARRALAEAGFYGNRVTVHQGDLSAIPYSNYFANLVVSERLMRTGQLDADPVRAARFVKPWGGVVCLGRALDAAGPRQWLEKMELGKQGTIREAGPWALLTRGALPGAGTWTHQYGEPGNSASTTDMRVKGDLGVLWFGDPGIDKMINRHEGTVSPLAVNGRMFIQGEFSVLAYDACNGTFLWERVNPKPAQARVSRNMNTGIMAASDDTLFMIVKDKCLAHDAATGEIKATFGLPAGVSAETHEWGYVAYHDGRLFGAATVQKELLEKLRRRGEKLDNQTEVLFALDPKRGKPLWTYQAKSIPVTTIAMGPGRVYFVDSSITSEQRAELLRQDKTQLKELTGAAAKLAEERMKRLDARVAVALDAASGKVLWSRPVDVTDCSEVGSGGGRLTLMHSQGVLLLCGANANGHFWKQFVEGEFQRRRLVALDAKDGSVRWAKDANYRHRPIIVEDRVLAEPWAFDLRTGEQQMRPHPLTGETVPWSIMRPGHHCGMISACPNMLLFRSGSTGYYDLKADAGTQHFAGHRLGCWVNAIPANGLVLIPEGSSGCVCLFSVSSTIVMEPREPRNPWSICSSVGPTTPVKHLALNLGAPGDRRDANGTMWLSYPRPPANRSTGLDLFFSVPAQFLKDGGYRHLNTQATTVKNAENSWIFTSWANGLSRCSVPLLGKDDAPALYTVKLYFADPDNEQAGQRVFDLKMQGKTVLEKFDIAEQAKGKLSALVREFKDIRVASDLQIEMIPLEKNPDKTQLPLLNGIEVLRTGSATK